MSLPPTLVPSPPRAAGNPPVRGGAQPAAHPAARTAPTALRPAGGPAVPVPARRIRAALVGLGPDAEAAHLPALHAQRHRVEVAALVDADAAMARRVRAAHAVPAAYRSLEELLGREHPELVHLATGASARTAAVLSCLRAGAWVLAEQPPARCLAEYDRISAAERPGGPFASVAGDLLLESGPRRLLGLARSGALGRPLGARLAVPWFRPSAAEGAGRRPEYGADRAAARGAELVELLPAVLGEWTEVRPAVARPGQRGGDAVPTLLVWFACGAVATVLPAPVRDGGQEPPLRLDFAEATAELRFLAARSDGVGAVPAVGPGGLAAGAPAGRAAVGGGGLGGTWGLTLAMAGRAGTTARAGRDAGARSEPPCALAAVLDAMPAGRRPHPGAGLRRAGLELLTGLHRAAATGRPVRRGQLGPADPFYHHLHCAPPVSRRPGPAPAGELPPYGRPARGGGYGGGTR
ncbi:Gfo/Idh/MocA family oxidoreductase [Actinacidiphila yeochonensis]|uniref:Gfo/Idh/MocA family oxidoreductase n=1 Tax=Actinacidiphila yeochonensis TaxID=89050 RepID=UPI0012FEA85E|nr:Gfo/Idh/MocA family oxidoreductase [Actinacidiphila yeochonensis]